jgi:isochorismate synthase
VTSLTDLIARGEAEKVVLARRQAGEADSEIDVAATLQRLRERYPTCTVFAVREGPACFLGATPETLVRLHDGVVSADCLAGSARRGATPEQDEASGAVLLADDKERREHAMVVRGLIESIEDACEGLEAPAAPVLRRMANVQHMHTPIRARLRGAGHVLDLVERLHPTPATGGLPRGRALCLIREHEAFDRGWYAGPLGWIDARGGGEFAVALRSALVRGREAYLYAGCGIVRGSDPEREYEESSLKLGAMLGALGTP